jgi:hypothetical protein
LSIKKCKNLNTSGSRFVTQRHQFVSTAIENDYSSSSSPGAPGLAFET